MVLRHILRLGSPVPGHPARRVALVAVLLALLVATGPAGAAPEDATAGKAARYVWRGAGKAGLEVHGLSGLRMHRQAPGVLWAHVHGLGAARSEDDGRTWQPMMKGLGERDLPGLRSQVRITHDPRAAEIMYLVVDGRLYRSEDGGASWSSISSGALVSLSWERLRSRPLGWEVRVDPKKSLRLLVGTRTDGLHNGGLFESTNGGKSWEEIAGSVQSESGLGHDTYLVRLDPKTDKAITVAGRTAVWYSDDRGRSFARNDPGGEGLHDVRDLSEFVPGSKELFLADVRGIWRSKDGGKRWDKKPLRAGDALVVVLDSHNRKRVFAVFNDRGLEVSDDARHDRWLPLGGDYERGGDAEGDPEGGYAAAEIRGIVPHPGKRNTIYLTSPVTGLHRSEDGGETFVPVQPPEGADAQEIIPATMPRMALVGVHPAAGGVHLAVSEFGVVYRSSDRCATWERVGRLGASPGLLQPATAAHGWWAAGHRLLASADDGATWTVAYAPEDPEERIVGLSQRAGGDGAPETIHLLLERSGLLVVSTDGGKNWEPRAVPGFPSSETWAASLATDDDDPDHFLVAARTVRVVWSPRDASGGIFETWDGGRTWKDVTGNLRPEKNAGGGAREKADWNRGRFVAIDRGAGLLVYGADAGGIHVRPIGTAKPKKGAETPPWVAVTPPAPEHASIDTHVHTRTADGKDTYLVVYLRGRSNETSVFAVTGKQLAALHAYELAETKPESKPGWSPLPNPGAQARLRSLAADGQLPGRLLAADAEGENGILIYEIPGSTPVVAADTPDPGDDGEKEVPGSVPSAPPTLVPPEGMRAFSASRDGTVRIWRVDKGESTQTLDGAGAEIRGVVLSPDEQWLVAGGADKTVRIWSASNAKIAATIPTGSVVNAIVVDDDSRYAYVALEEKKQILQIDLVTREMRAFEGHGGGVLALAVSEDVNRVYSGGLDQTVRVWDTKEAMEVLEIAVGAKVHAVAVARDGSRIYVAAGDNSVRIYNPAGEETGRHATGGDVVHALRLDPGNGRLFAATDGGVLTLGAQDAKPALLYRAANRKVLSLCVSADGKWILGGDAEGGLWLWAVGAEPPHWTLGQAHAGAILGLALTPDESTGAEAVPVPGNGAAPGPGNGEPPGKDGPPK